MNRVAVVGVGLIGGSFALALKQAGFVGEIVGVSSPGTIEKAISLGAISRGLSLREAAKTADLIYLAQPIEHILQTLPELGRLVGSNCLVTDAGSTKSEIVSCAQALLPSGTFLGGHPMAGKEKRGVEHADADLFRGRPYVVMPNESPAAAEFRSWLRAIGAEVVEMEPEQHDITVAFTSHLPQLISTALSATLSAHGSEHTTEVFGPGLLDMTRLALSAPEVWMSVLSTNKPALREALAAFRSTLAHLEQQLADDDIKSLFTAAAGFARAIREP